METFVLLFFEISLFHAADGLLENTREMVKNILQQQYIHYEYATRLSNGVLRVDQHISTNRRKPYIW